MNDNKQPGWLEAAKAHGWSDIARAGLDALAPLGPLGAQLVWVSQPVLGLFVRRDRLASLAEALETPEGLAALRRRLDDEADPTPRP
jgi:hypothetical protein